MQDENQPVDDGQLDPMSQTTDEVFITCTEGMAIIGDDQTKYGTQAFMVFNFPVVGDQATAVLSGRITKDKIIAARQLIETLEQGIADTEITDGECHVLTACVTLSKASN